jgi:hypothetical protein
LLTRGAKYGKETKWKSGAHHWWHQWHLLCPA